MLIDFDSALLVSDYKRILEILKILRASFSIEPINVDKLIEIGIIPTLFKICLAPEFSDQEEIQYEICWIVVNALSGDNEQIQYFITNGVLDIIMNHLKRENSLFKSNML